MAIVKYGTEGDDIIFADVEDGADSEDQVINGLGGNDWISGAKANDYLIGGTGNDVLIADGVDGVNGYGSDYLEGGDGNDQLFGQGANDTLVGGAGNDLLHGDGYEDPSDPRGGDDIIYAGSGNDDCRGGIGNDIIYANTGADHCQGGEGNDTIYADGSIVDGADILDGGGGDDIYDLSGGGLNFYIADSGGTDLIMHSLDLVLVPEYGEIENLTLTGGLAVSGWGNGLNNIIRGNGAANTLIGFAGADELFGNGGNDVLDGGNGYVDTLRGASGDDTYIVSDFDDIWEDVNQGTDTVVSSVRWVLADNFENLALTGGNAINGFGNTLGNRLTGNAARNYLDGAQGLDTLEGGGGGDYYRLGDATLIGGSYTWDTVIEGADAGNDTVSASADGGRYTYQLTANVENLIATGVSVFRLWGNELGNSLTGNDAANDMSGFDGGDWLDGGFGADLMAGGNGNDTYVLGDTFVINVFDNLRYDTVTEVAGGGKDMILVNADAPSSSLSGAGYTLGAYIENGMVTGAAKFFLKGNELSNQLTGNSANNTLTGFAGRDQLEGGGGADTLLGGDGNDKYILSDSYLVGASNTWDTVSELDGEGRDTVFASSTVGRYTYQLTDNVENLTATGASVFRLWGNKLDNELTGNVAANEIDGFGGNDTLTGGLGADLFYFTTKLKAANTDEITDFTVADDTFRLDDAVFVGIGAVGNLAAGAFRTGDAAADAGDRIIYNAVTGALLFDVNGNGTGGAVRFATIDAGLALTSADFAVI